MKNVLEITSALRDGQVFDSNNLEISLGREEFDWMVAHPDETRQVGQAIWPVGWNYQILLFMGTRHAEEGENPHVMYLHIGLLGNDQMATGRHNLGPAHDKSLVERRALWSAFNGYFNNDEKPFRSVAA